jgi:hypothetical protein
VVTPTVGNPRSRSPGAKVERRVMPTALLAVEALLPPPLARKEVFREFEEEELGVVPEEALLLALLGTRIEFEGCARPLRRASL